MQFRWQRKPGRFFQKFPVVKGSFLILVILRRSSHILGQCLAAGWGGDQGEDSVLGRLLLSPSLDSAVQAEAGPGGRWGGWHLPAREKPWFSA